VADPREPGTAGGLTAGAVPGIVVDVDGALGLTALQRPWRTLRRRIGPQRDHRSVMGMGAVVRLVVREFPDAPVVYLSAAPALLARQVRQALGEDGYPPGTLRMPARAAATWRGGGTRYKRDVLREVLADSGYRWILLGDDDGPDPALFAHAGARANVVAIALRHVERAAPDVVARVRQRVREDVAVLAAPTGEELVGHVRPLLGRQEGRIDDWFLTAPERGNPATALPPWTEGNHVHAHVHGRPYLEALGRALRAAGDGDLAFIAGWRADGEQILDSSKTGPALATAAARGVLVRGLLWRSHRPQLGYHAPTHRALAEAVALAGGRLLLDHRVRPFGSHHQKFAVVRYRDRPTQDAAFVGGIDIAASRRDDASHVGDRLTRPFPEVYGPRPPWHDVQVEIRGPAVADVELGFRERWGDPTPLVRAPWRVLEDARIPRRADRLPPPAAPPPRAGRAAVQILRTYPRRLTPFPFAPDGERSVARGYAKALLRAERLVYVEDQYLWSADVARVFAAALHRAPDLQLIAVVPRFPDQESPIEVPPASLGQSNALDLVRQVGGDRVQVLDVEREDGTPVYVHAKLTVIDDVWAAVGSANLNRRSWTNDSELVAAVLDQERDTRAPADPAGLGDGARRFARDLRLTLMREHLGRADGDDADLIDPDEAAATVRAAAAALDTWHAGGRRGPRPPGRLRVHPDPPAHPWLVRLGASALYQAGFDPDGRPFGKRLRRTF